jgi:polysaccharide biosynthesis protein VpsJ
MRTLLNVKPEKTLPLFEKMSAKPQPASCFINAVVMEHLEPLLNYVRERSYEGNDLFDGLNSRLFKNTPLYKNSFFRLALIQFCKQSPVNFRSLFMVPAGFNPKGGALFLMGHLNLLQKVGGEVYENDAYVLYQRLRHVCIQREHGNAWGYNFDWQARAFYVPEGTPNLVTSVYVGRSLLAYYRRFADAEALSMALGVSEFLLNEMIKFENPKFICFNYIPGKDAEVHNANLLGAAYLAETLAYMPEGQQTEIRKKILKSVRFSLMDVNEDGSWPYGTLPFHRWVDNFHTAFNIESLISVTNHLQTDEFLPVLKQVIDYYLANLFTEDGTPKYYNQQLYPIDIHVLAETIVLFQLLRTNGLVWQPERMVQIENVLLHLTESLYKMGTSLDVLRTGFLCLINHNLISINNKRRRLTH